MDRGSGRAGDRGLDGSRLFPPLIALAGVMLAVSVALAAVLVAGGSSTDGGPAALALTATPASAATTPSSVAPTAPTEPAAPSVVVAPAIPSELQARLDALPAKLREEVAGAFQSGVLTLEQVELVIGQYENRNPDLRVGSVLSTSPDRLRFEVYLTGEALEVMTAADTAIRRAGAPIALEDLRRDELVLVVTSADGASALSIEAMGVAVP